MGTLGVILACAVLLLGNCYGSPATLPAPAMYDTIVIGMGPAGTAAASTLAAAGRKVLALEAQNRVGGRVNTVPFGDGVIELGAEWIHGTESSSVYELALKNNVSILPQEFTFKVYNSDGTSDREDIVNDLTRFTLEEVVDDPPKDPEPLGQYVTRRLIEYIKANHSSVENDTEFFESYLNFLDLVINNYESSNSWNDVTTHSRYEELGGHQHMSWHKYGYKTLFEILLNTYKDGPGYPSLEIKLNTEVTKIEWPQDPKDNVVVTVKDGTTYTAKNVIVTVSVGVLKERHTSLFSPPLPKQKAELIDVTAIGVVNKICLLFSDAFWPRDGSFYGFIWNAKDKKRVEAKYWWTTKIFGASCPMGNSHVLTVWTSGDGAKLVETLPEDVVKRKVMEVIRKFMGTDRTIPEPIAMMRSNWFSNPFTRGSYTYDNLQSPAYVTAREDLARPLTDAAGKPRVLFAGEATDSTHFSTVHGAVDSGRREAARLLQTNSKI